MRRAIVIATGAVSTFAGSGTKGHADGDAASARFNDPADVAVSGTAHTPWPSPLTTAGGRGAQTSIAIGDELSLQEGLMKGMNEDFFGAGGMLGGSMKRLQKLTGASSNSFMCYLIGFCVFVFLLIYSWVTAIKYIAMIQLINSKIFLKFIYLNKIIYF